MTIGQGDLVLRPFGGALPQVTSGGPCGDGRRALVWMQAMPAKRYDFENQIEFEVAVEIFTNMTANS